MNESKNKKIKLIDVKAALRDARFREMLPKDLDKEVNEFLSNPTCPCNVPLYRKIITNCKEQLMKYFPNREVADEAKELNALAQNNWSVLNCHIDELEKKLRDLPPGRKQMAITRYQEEVTVVINELDIVF